MNDLNVRVAALKLCAHPKDSPELRETYISLPSKWKLSQASYVLMFTSACSSSKQVIAVKTIFHQSHDEADSTVAEFLSDVLFACPLKHAVRNQLTKLFSDKGVSNHTTASHTKESLQQALIKSLRSISDDIKGNSNATGSWLNDKFVSISACLQNFPYGREALESEIYRIVPLLPKTLEHYWETISNTAGDALSPTRRNHYYLFIHNILRFHVAIMSEWNIKLFVSDCEPLRKLDILANKIARDMDTPWDVRSIAGLVIGHNAKLFNEFDKYLNYCCKQLASNELPIQAGALLMLQSQEYITFADNALSILQRILAVATKDGNVTNILVFLSKQLFIYSKSLDNIIELHNHAMIKYKLIISALQNFAIQHISSSIDSVRHMCSSLLRQVLQLALNVKLEEAFEYVYKQFEHQPMSLNSRCLMLEQLAVVLGVKSVIDNCPSLFKTVFPNYLGREDCVDALFKTMMTAAYATQTLIDWQNMWCDMLMRIAKEQDERLSGIERLIMHSAKLSPEYLKLLLHQEVPLSSKITVMLTIRSVEQRREVLALYMPQLHNALIGLDDHTRLLALRLVVDIPRPSECFGSDELKAIMLYLEHNTNNPSAHIRQIAYGLLQKSLKRMDLTLAQHMKRPTNAGQELLQFLPIIMGTLSNNLFPTANYGRRWISLRLLRQCIDMCRLHGLSLEDKLPTVVVPYLELCLSDSYEHNKVHAAYLLCLVNKKSRLRPDKIMEMLLSIRPPDSVTGAYQLQVYCQSETVEEELPGSTETSVYEPRIYNALMWCYAYLREGASFAQQDLAEAAKVNPLYGLLFASRHLIMQLQLDKLAQEHKWRQYIQELVDLCMTISQVVLPIVSNSSPEGYLPANQCKDGKGIENANVLRRRLNGKTLQKLNTTPQMVLLCGWRTIKEIALILGELVERSPLEQENPKSYLIGKTQLAAIGDHFLMLLAETKHRGAFEQAYVGFTMLCRRFWLSDQVSLNQLPNLWVEEAVHMIQGSNPNLCSTRRSAGMPFMLQALICTELKLGTHGTLHRTMSLLLEICERPVSSSVNNLSRSHSLNILRALYRCSELADIVGEFVSRGVICALSSLLAKEWAERNSATLMLAALIVRIFGVERARSYEGDFHVRNRMTGRVFFTRYPELFDFFYIGLKQAALKIVESNMRNWSIGQTVQLEAMLLILCRLYPSSMEGSESSLNLTEFVPFLMSITSSHDLITRERASQVLANFVSPHRAVDIILKVIVYLKVLHQQLQRDSEQFRKTESRLKLDRNYLHGQVLQLRHLYRVLRWTNPSVACLMIHTLSQLAVEIHYRDIFIFIAIMDVLVAIMEDVRDSHQVNQQLMDTAFGVYRLNHTLIYEKCEEYGTSPRSYNVFALHLHRLILNKNLMVHHMGDTMRLQRNLPLDVEHLNVELWLYAMFQSAKISGSTRCSIDNYDIDYYNFNEDIVNYYEALESPQRKELVAMILESENMYTIILQLLDKVATGRYFSPKLSCRLYALLAMLNKPTLTLEQLLERYSTDDANELQSGLVLNIIRIVTECGIEQSLWMPVLHYSLQTANPDQTNYMRRKSSQFCEQLTKCINQQVCIGDVDIIGHYCRLVIVLLLDESEFVRNNTAEMISINLLSDESENVLKTSNILPCLTIAHFLNNILNKLPKDHYNVAFLMRLYNIIVEPFINAAQFKESNDLSSLPEEQVEFGKDFELFDKQETNLYCEELYAISEIKNCFKTVFHDNQELMKILKTSNTFISYDVLDKAT